MPDGEAYASAAFRHFEDAQHLFAIGRVDNSAYLAGYVVECSFKLLLQCAERSSPKPLGHDLANLAGRALVLAAILAPGAERYQVDHPDVQYAFRRWTPDMRYTGSGGVTASDSQRLLGGARSCLEGIVGSLILDGIAELPT